jgi:hypothetical protein
MSAIGPENVIDKMCFGLLGFVDSKSLQALRSRLIATAKQDRAAGREAPSRPAIYDLFKGAVPTREVTFSFLSEVVEQAIADKDVYADFSSDRKKVLGQIRTFCSRQLKQALTQDIYGTSGGHITIRQERILDPKHFAEQTEYFAGTYRIFKRRFLPSTTKPFSEEFLQIEKVGSHLHAIWWVLLDDKKPAEYRGALSMTENAVWAFLYNPSLGGRFRVFNATRTGWGRVHPQVYTGLLLTTSPHPQRPKPSAARIFVEKIETLSEEKIRSRLRHFGERSLKHPKRALILKVISNEVAPDENFEAREDLLVSAVL